MWAQPAPPSERPEARAAHASVAKGEREEAFARPLLEQATQHARPVSTRPDKVRAKRRHHPRAQRIVPTLARPFTDGDILRGDDEHADGERMKLRKRRRWTSHAPQETDGNKRRHNTGPGPDVDSASQFAPERRSRCQRNVPHRPASSSETTGRARSQTVTFRAVLLHS